MHRSPSGCCGSSGEGWPLPTASSGKTVLHNYRLYELEVEGLVLGAVVQVIRVESKRLQEGGKRNTGSKMAVAKASETFISLDHPAMFRSA
eukprot:611115-Amphidinium_carterae.1